MPMQAPGNYPGTGLAHLINCNHQYFLWQNQSVPAGTASVAVQLERQKSASYPFGFSFEVGFSASPGAFQVDFQFSDTDDDAHYVTRSSMTSGLNASFVGRQEFPSVWAKFARAKMVTLTNAVNTTVQVTR